MAATYDVVTIAPTVLLTAVGQGVRGQLITFLTKPSGITGELRIADDEFTPEAADAALTAAAATLERVKAL